MPRRIWTYSAELGVGELNFVSTLGAYLIGAGVLIFVIDLVRNFRVGEGGDPNPWGAGTLEWLPQNVYSTRSIPRITSRDPLWNQPELAAEVERGEHYLPNAPTGGRETIVTSAINARPEYVIQMPGPSWTQFSAAVFTAACFLLLTIKVVAPAMICGAAAIASCFAWVWQLDKGPGSGPVDIGGGIRLPTYMTGPSGHGWWAMIILAFVAGSLYFAYLFSYLYIWTVSPEVWPAVDALASIGWPLASAAAFAGSVIAFRLANRRLAAAGRRFAGAVPWLVLAGAVLAVGGVAIEFSGHWQTGLRPTESSYAAMVFMATVLNLELVVAIVLMAGFAAARVWRGQVDAVRNACIENTSLLVYYTAGQAALGLVVIHAFPRLL